MKSDNDRILGIDRPFNLGAVYVTNLVYKNSKVFSKETGDPSIFLGPMFLHWEGSFLPYHTFLSHLKARIHETVNCIDLRFGSDDKSGLTKAIDSVFPNSSRLLCTKHIKYNVSDHLKNKIGCKDDTDSINNFKIIWDKWTIDTAEFDVKAREISRDHTEFDPYFQTHLKDRLREYVNIPKRQLRHDRLWTNNNCESMNHIFKRAVNWTPKSIPELIQNLHDIVKVQLIDMKRSLFGTGNYELCGTYRRHLMSYQTWQSKTTDQQEKIFSNLLKVVNFKSDTVKTSFKDFEVPRSKRLAAKPYQTKRPRTCRTKPRF